ncbi:MAG: succinylglutamate desuccinylase, partial [Rhodobacterales bacterium]|nr:succinylglutamate desuccinylase [Rhodobacterales bacterium]
MTGRDGFAFGGVTLAPGERRTVDLPVSVLSDHTPVTMSVRVIHG